MSGVGPRRQAWVLAACYLHLLLVVVGGTATAQVVTPKRPGPISEFLRPPRSGGADYRDPIDWSAVPPWRQTTFYGVRAEGQVFAFVVDASGSMGDGARLARAKAELRRSVGALRWPQQFVVLFYNEETMAFAGGVPQPADASSKSKLAGWLRVVEADGGTDPRPAMQWALGLQPDAVFLLSDGEYPEGTAAAVARANPKRVPIHTIDMTGRAEGGQLEAIARESGGEFARRP